MTQFLLALAVFLALHSVPAIPAIRTVLVERLGRRAYLVLYSLVSLATLGWVFHAAFRLDYVPLWDPAPWQAWLALMASPIALFLLVTGLVSPNPASITFRRGDAAYGAITTVTRHPVLWGFLFWAFGHLVANGDLRSLMLFGVFVLFALFGMLMAERRGSKRNPAWNEITATTSIVPFAAVVVGRTRLRIDRAMIIGFIIALALTIWLLSGGHAAIFGADPLAMATA